jgi:hypothetical protein
MYVSYLYLQQWREYRIKKLHRQAKKQPKNLPKNQLLQEKMLKPMASCERVFLNVFDVDSDDGKMALTNRIHNR